MLALLKAITAHSGFTAASSLASDLGTAGVTGTDTGMAATDIAVAATASAVDTDTATGAALAGAHRMRVA